MCKAVSCESKVLLSEDKNKRAGDNCEVDPAGRDDQENRGVGSTIEMA